MRFLGRGGSFCGKLFTATGFEGKLAHQLSQPSVWEEMDTEILGCLAALLGMR